VLSSRSASAAVRMGAAVSSAGPAWTLGGAW
jgi:hypothetical protein